MLFFIANKPTIYIYFFTTRYSLLTLNLSTEAGVPGGPGGPGAPGGPGGP